MTKQAKQCKQKIFSFICLLSRRVEHKIKTRNEKCAKSLVLLCKTNKSSHKRSFSPSNYGKLMLNRTFPLAVTFLRLFMLRVRRSHLISLRFVNFFCASRQGLEKFPLFTTNTPHISSLNRRRPRKCNRDNVVIFYGLPHRQLRDIFGLSKRSGREKWRHLSAGSRIERHETRNSVKLRSEKVVGGQPGVKNGSRQHICDLVSKTKLLRMLEGIRNIASLAWVSEGQVDLIF